MKLPFLILLSAAIASAIFVGWRVHAMRNHEINHFALVQDPSLSFTGGCQSMIGSAEEVLRNPGVSAESTLTVLVLGDGTTAYEPWRLGKYPIPWSRKVIEGKAASVKSKEMLLRNLWTRCNSVRHTSVSPIFLGVTQAIANLRADGCKEGSQCGMSVNSDLEENGDRAVKERINRGRDAGEPLPEPLDNRGIAITLCGFAQTAGHIVGPSGREIGKAVARDPQRDDHLQAVWRSLFASPEIVRFEPYCPQSNDLRAYEAAASPKE